jgi:hypothetical protein
MHTKCRGKKTYANVRKYHDPKQKKKKIAKLNFKYLFEVLKHCIQNTKTIFEIKHLKIIRF